jgi:hypothetical protein
VEDAYANLPSPAGYITARSLRARANDPAAALLPSLYIALRIRSAHLLERVQRIHGVVCSGTFISWWVTVLRHRIRSFQIVSECAQEWQEEENEN